MNVLLVAGKMQCGGAETHVKELAEELLERGHEVTLACAGGAIAHALGGLGVSLVFAPLDKKDPISLLRCRRILLSAARVLDLHVIHAHTRLAALAACYVGKKLGVGTVTTAHACFKMRGLRGEMSRWGDSVIAVSQDIRQHLLESDTALPLEKIHVVPNGIDTDRFCPCLARESARTVAFVSRLDADCSEAAYALCRISEQLGREMDGVRIIIVGGGSELCRITELAKGINTAAGRELICVRKEVKRVERVLREADVFVGVSRAALEAMSCGIPTVLAGNEGFLGALDKCNADKARKSNFCCRGEEKISDQALLREVRSLLLMSRAEREENGRYLREYVIKNHSRGHTADLTEQVYREAIRCGAIRSKKGEAVLLCGYYGYGNIGDDALLLRAVERAGRRYPACAVCAMTAHGARDGAIFGVRCARRGSPLSLAREIRRARTVVFGGGTLLQNSTSSRSLIYYLFILRYARYCNRRIELWANGIGRIEGGYLRRATARALSGCDRIGLRDAQSLREAAKLLEGYSPRWTHLSVEEDLALRAFPEDAERQSYLNSRFNIPTGARIAVAAFKRTERGDGAEEMKEFLRGLSRDGVIPVLTVMYPDEDLRDSRRICDEIGGILAYPIGISDIAGLMRRACIALGMRYHALVFACSVGTPFVGFGSEPKIERFCRSHGGVYFTDLQKTDIKSSRSE